MPKNSSQGKGQKRTKHKRSLVLLGEQHTKGLMGLNSIKERERARERESEQEKRGGAIITQKETSVDCPATHHGEWTPNKSIKNVTDLFKKKGC
jgi:hypothetical protein